MISRNATIQTSGIGHSIKQQTLAAICGAAIALVLATGLSVELGRELEQRASTQPAIASQPLADQSPGMSTAAATAESAPRVYVVGSQPKADALDDYLAQSLAQRSVPAGSRVIVAATGEDVSGQAGGAQVIDLRRK